MRSIFLAAALAATSFVANAQPSGSLSRALPPFLAPYYSEALAIVGKDMVLIKQEQQEGLTRYVYEWPDHTANVSLQSFMCERDRCQVLYDNALKYFDKIVTEKAGNFSLAAPTEFAAQWKTGLAANFCFVAKLPNSVLFFYI